MKDIILTIIFIGLIPLFILVGSQIFYLLFIFPTQFIISYFKGNEHL